VKIIALDPGGTTGWATFDDTAPEGASKFNFGHIGPEEHHEKLQAFLELQTSQTDTRVVCESFEYRKGLRDNVVMVSLEYIGIVKLHCEIYGMRQSPNGSVVFPQLIMQTAATGKAFWKDDKLKRLGLFQPGWKHANDATRHLLTYLCTLPEWKDKLLRSLKD